MKMHSFIFSRGFIITKKYMNNLFEFEMNNYPETTSSLASNSAADSIVTKESNESIISAELDGGNSTTEQTVNSQYIKHYKFHSKKEDCSLYGLVTNTFAAEFLDSLNNTENFISKYSVSHGDLISNKHVVLFCAYTKESQLSIYCIDRNEDAGSFDGFFCNFLYTLH
jgi:hypothetical protein